MLLKEILKKRLVRNTIWTEEYITEWLETPSKVFGDRSPSQVIDAGDYHLIEKMFEKLNL